MITTEYQECVCSHHVVSLLIKNDTSPLTHKKRHFSNNPIPQPKQSARLLPRLLPRRGRSRSDWRKRRRLPLPPLLRPSVLSPLKLLLRRRLPPPKLQQRRSKRLRPRKPLPKRNSPSRRLHLVLPSISSEVSVAAVVASLLLPQLRSKQQRPLPPVRPVEFPLSLAGNKIGMGRFQASFRDHLPSMMEKQ
jgi:hypothetical protein